LLWGDPGPFGVVFLAAPTCGIEEPISLRFCASIGAMGFRYEGFGVRGYSHLDAHPKCYCCGKSMNAMLKGPGLRDALRGWGLVAAIQR
jgi:hypothetical protein